MPSAWGIYYEVYDGLWEVGLTTEPDASFRYTCRSGEQFRSFSFWLGEDGYDTATTALAVAFHKLETSNKENGCGNG
jgi:hypothetical protein